MEVDLVLRISNPIQSIVLIYNCLYMVWSFDRFPLRQSGQYLRRSLQRWQSGSLGCFLVKLFHDWVPIIKISPGWCLGWLEFLAWFLMILVDTEYSWWFNISIDFILLILWELHFIHHFLCYNLGCLAPSLLYYWWFSLIHSLTLSSGRRLCGLWYGCVSLCRGQSLAGWDSLVCCLVLLCLLSLSLFRFGIRTWGWSCIG